MTTIGVDHRTEESSTTESSAQDFSAYQNRLDQIATRNVRVGPTDRVSYPAQYSAIRDPPHVKKMKYYKSMQSVYGGITAGDPQVVMTFTDDDVKAMQEKERMEAQVDFDTWISERYHPWDNPVDTAWLMNIYRGFFDARLKESKTVSELQQQWTAMQITGPKTKEDLYLLFRVERDPDLAARIGATNQAPSGEGADAVATVYNKGRWRRAYHYANSVSTHKAADTATGLDWTRHNIAGMTGMYMDRGQPAPAAFAAPAWGGGAAQAARAKRE